MEKITLKWVFLVTMSVMFMLSFSTVCFSAESTADASADPNLKNKLRQQILGEKTKTLNSEYVVGYRDILHISIYGEGSMSARGSVDESASSNPAGTDSGGNFIRGRGAGIEVRMDGRISVRHIGDISVVGMTLTQIADYLKQLYSTIYENPHLTVTLVQSNSLQYTLMGQVSAPGLFHLDFPLTIVQAIARAGGLSEWANSEVTVIRQGPGSAKNAKGESKKSTFKFDYDDFLKGVKLERNITIMSGDVIIVH